MYFKNQNNNIYLRRVHTNTATSKLRTGHYNTTLNEMEKLMLKINVLIQIACFFFYNYMMHKHITY